MQDTTKVTRARLAFACASTAILGVFGAGTAFAVSAHTTAKSGDQGKCEQGHGQGHDQGNCNGQGNGGGDDDGDGSGGGGGGGGGNPLQPVIDQVQQAVTDALSQVPQPPSGGGGGGGGAPAPTDCSTGGLSDATVAYQLYVGSGQGAGLDEADHPNAKQWNQQVESQAGPLTPAAHEVGCGIAALEALQASGGSGGGGGNPLQPVIDQVQQAVTDALSQVPQPPSGGGGGGGGAPAPTDCSTGGLSDATVAYQLYVGSGQGTGLDEASYPNATAFNSQVESQAGPLTPAAHEVGCGIAALEALGASAPQPPAGLPVDPTTVAGQVTDAANGAAQTVSDATGGVVPNPLSH